ncbi:MAG TPA: hypothetical protein PLS49_07105, partial [Candidatus Woesebacteria bacterium]|nr:hypothetical protein [Candidatus Woesebacteria bacterium]
MNRRIKRDFMNTVLDELLARAVSTGEVDENGVVTVPQLGKLTTNEIDSLRDVASKEKMVDIDAMDKEIIQKQEQGERARLNLEWTSDEIRREYVAKAEAV